MKLHNALWPGLVGKGFKKGQERPISFQQMLQFTAAARCGDRKFDGVDLFLFHPHIDPNGSDDAIRKMADEVAATGLSVGSLVAPVWPGTVGGSAMGGRVERRNFLTAVRAACEIAQILDTHGVRKYGVIRIDSADNPENWSKDPQGNTALIAETFKDAGRIAADHGQRLAAEGEICWAGMHSWRNMLDLLEAVGMQGTVGFQADLAHTYLYLMGYNAPEHALLKEGYSAEEFWPAYAHLVKQLRPWTIDFHVAQNDGQVKGSGAHDKTGKHCMPSDPNGKLDIAKCAKLWLDGAEKRGIHHACWDGCMFPNKLLKQQSTWGTILSTMVAVDAALVS